MKASQFSIMTILVELKDLVKSNKQEQFTKANEWLAALQGKPEKIAALQQCFKAFGIPFEKSEEVIQAQTPTFPAMPPRYFGKYFDQARYQQAYSLCALAYLFEKNGIVAEHATKLAVMFDSPAAMLDYLSNFAKSDRHNKTLLHNACLFALPDFSEPGFLDDNHGCKFELFKAMAAKGDNMLRRDFKEMLPFAWELQKIVVNKKTEATVNNIQVDQNKIKAKEALITKIRAEVDQLERRKNAYNFDEEQYKKLIQSLSQQLSELAVLSAGKFLKDLSFLELKAFYEAYKLGTQGAYKIFIDNGIPEKYFSKFKQINRQQAGRNIPDMTVDGKTIGHPGYYLMKVPVEDELHAARAACFGKMTDCCQSLSGEAGQPCVIHGLTSPNGGFYVLCEGDSQHPNVNDKVLAMSWVWRSQSEAIVFDSIEVSQYVRENNQTEMVKKFYEHLGRELVNNHHTKKVACGSQSGISDQVGLNIEGITIEGCKDYNDYRDSYQQRMIYSADEPYYFYHVDEESRLRTDTMINHQKDPLLKNKKAFFLNIVHKLPMAVVEYLIKQKDFVLSDEQLDMIFNEILKRHDDYAMLEFIEKFPRTLSTPENFAALYFYIIEPNKKLFYTVNKSKNELLKAIAKSEIHCELTDEQKKVSFLTALSNKNLDFMKWLWHKHPELEQLLSIKDKADSIKTCGKYSHDTAMADFLMEQFGHQIPKYKVLEAFGSKLAAKYLKGRETSVKKWPTVIVEPQEKSVKPKRPLPQTPQRQQHQKVQGSAPKRPLPKPPAHKPKI